MAQRRDPAGRALLSYVGGNIGTKACWPVWTRGTDAGSRMLPSVIGGAGWCLGANHYLWPTKFAAAPSLFHLFRDFSRLYWRQRWIG